MYDGLGAHHYFILSRFMIIMTQRNFNHILCLYRIPMSFDNIECSGVDSTVIVGTMKFDIFNTRVSL